MLVVTSVINILDRYKHMYIKDAHTEENAMQIIKLACQKKIK